MKKICMMMKKRATKYQEAVLEVAPLAFLEGNQGAQLEIVIAFQCCFDVMKIVAIVWLQMSRIFVLDNVYCQVKLDHVNLAKLLIIRLIAI